jgi:hypothetical protein
MVFFWGTLITLSVIRKVCFKSRYFFFSKLENTHVMNKDLPFTLRLPDELIRYVSLFLLGIDKFSLRRVNKMCTSKSYLQYDGPLPTNKRLVKVFLRSTGSIFFLKTPNLFFYVTCPRPTYVEVNRPDWVMSMAVDALVPPSSFVCASLTYLPSLDTLDILARSLCETLTAGGRTDHDQLDPQQLKLLFLLATFHLSPVVLQYVLNYVIMIAHLPLIYFLVNEKLCRPVEQTLALLLISNDYPSKVVKLEVIDLILRENKDLVVGAQFDFWPLKYTVQDGSTWEEFTVLYKHVLQHCPHIDFVQLEREICNSLPENAQMGTSSLLATFRKSLYPAF